MAGEGLVRLSPEQVADARTNLENLNKLIKNGDALIDAGVMTKEQLEQTKQTKDIIERTLKAYPAS